MKLLVIAMLGIALVSVEDEIAIGRRANAKVRREVVELHDGEVTAYVRGIGARLARNASGPKYPYSFSLTNDRAINAFALPGGPIWINRGVLEAAGNESEVAAVLAHEIAHVAERHAARQITNGAFANWGLSLLSSMLGNIGGASAARTAAGAMTGSIFLKFSREDEADADRVGLQILTRAGWDPRGMVELFDLLERTQKRNPDAVSTFFSTHPPLQDRIALVQADARRHAGGRRDTVEFHRIKTRIRNLPR